MDDLLSDYKLVTFHANQDNEIYRTHKEPNCRTHKATVTAYRTLKETAYMTLKETAYPGKAYLLNNMR